MKKLETERMLNAQRCEDNDIKRIAIETKKYIYCINLHIRKMLY